MICWAICSLSSAASTRPANASNAQSRSRRCWREATTIWSGAAPSRAMTTVCCNGWKPRSPRRGWKRRNACGFTSRSARRRTILATTRLAMQHFDAADAVRRDSASFDSAAFSIEIDRLIARCTPELIARAPELGSGDATPVLIIGMPRSGTTLVEQIVSMHPEVGAGGELNFWNERGAAWHRSGAAGNETPFLAKAAADYLGVLRAIAPKAARVTDKMPFNFLWAGLIHLAFPRATHHPLPPRCSRHGAVDPSNSFPSGPGVSDRRRRTGRVFPQLPAAHRPLAERAAG